MLDSQQRLTQSARALLAALTVLTAQQNRRGAFLSVKLQTLASMTHCHENSLRRMRPRLVARGLIYVESRELGLFMTRYRVTDAGFAWIDRRCAYDPATLKDLLPGCNLTAPAHVANFPHRPCIAQNAGSRL